VVEDADGEVAALVGVCHDVTERARAERALGAGELRIRAILDNSPSLIVVKDLEGRILMTNAEAQRVSGISAADSVGRRSDEVLPADVAAAQHEIEQRAASEGEPVYGEVVTAVGGEARSYVTVTFPLPDADGNPVELCTIATDVTAQREHESERRARLQLTEEIASALDEARMMVYAQPIVDLSDDTHHASELLVRMRSRRRGTSVLGPDAFLPDAERFELVQAIDTWMVRNALDLPEAERLHVNVSAMTMSDPIARAKIAELLEEDPAAARRIVFEITETASVERLDGAKAFAATVSELGATLALDDFGVGFGSFQYLRNLPFELIKIDAGFVSGVVKSAKDRSIVKSVIGIARNFGVKTVAEGIEDVATLEHVRELGVDFAQGHLLGRPSPLLPGILYD
jgi:PAS domain S-box-containing protein